MQLNIEDVLRGSQVEGAQYGWRNSCIPQSLGEDTGVTAFLLWWRCFGAPKSHREHCVNGGARNKPIFPRLLWTMTHFGPSISVKLFSCLGMVVQQHSDYCGLIPVELRQPRTCYIIKRVLGLHGLRLHFLILIWWPLWILSLINKTPPQF